MDEIEKLTACRDCEFCKGFTVPVKEHLCMHPALGEPEFNSYYGKWVCSEPPPCSEINTDGHCSYYNKG